MAAEPRLLDAVTTTGLGAGKLDTSELKQFLMMVPSLAEQQKIADCLTSIADLIKAADEQLDTLKVHKKGLMQQLFPNTNEEI